MPAIRPSRYAIATVVAGAVACAAIGLGSLTAHGPAFIASLQAQSDAARDRVGGAGITVGFRTPEGWLTRHPVLVDAVGVDAAVRGRVANAVNAVPGTGGVQWANAPLRAVPGAGATAMHCQDDVEAIVKARSIRFGEASAAIDPASEKLLDEVAAALRPCLGGIIAVTGHTDSGGDEGANRALSLARAQAVRWALIARGIPSDGLRAAGEGSQKPLEGLDRADTANRRIDFSVIEATPLTPTPVDTPGPD